MHGILYKKRCGNYSWTVGFDTGSSPGAYLIVEFEEATSGRSLIREFFFEENSPAHVRNFVEKLQRDEVYREQSLSSQAPWCRLAQWYEKNAWALSVDMTREKMPEDDEYAALFHGLKKHLSSLEAVAARVEIQNNSRLLCIDLDILDIVDTLNFHGATTRFSCRGSWHLIQSPFNQLELMLPAELHMPYAHVSFAAIGEKFKEQLLRAVPDSIFSGDVFRSRNAFASRAFVESLRTALGNLMPDSAHRI